MNEQERIRKVYQIYSESPEFQIKWDLKNKGNQMILNEREKAIQDLLKTFEFWPLEQFRILDVGCGTGKLLALFNKWGAKAKNLYGIDLIPERISEAKKNYPHINFIVGDASNMDFPDNSFDIVTIFTVFSSILDKSVANAVAKEIWRVLKPGGAILWYDFRYNNPNNPNVRGISKKEIVEFFPEAKLHYKVITLLPPLARRLGKLTSMLYPILVKIPFLRTHYLALLIKPKELGNANTLS